MGINTSILKSSDRTDVEQFYSNAMGNHDFSELDDLLIDILSYVPAKDLIRNCRLVCKKWKDLIDGHSIWKEKCQREHKCIPPVVFKSMPSHFYEDIYFYEPYGRNLIHNPCGKDGLNKWRVVSNGRDGVVIENPPAGADPVPPEVGSQSCFSTSYSPCIKYQILNLKALGVSEEVLQLKTTRIHIGEWYAARFDCASEYKLNVTLLDENFDEHSYKNLEDNAVDSFEYEFREEQWIGKEWHEVTHIFEDVGKVRYVYFQHFGKDCQFWAGNYGIKITGAFVKILV